MVKIIGDVDSCYNAGPYIIAQGSETSVSGGLIGWCYSGSVSNCLNYGEARAQGTGTIVAGGLIGVYDCPSSRLSKCVTFTVPSIRDGQGVIWRAMAGLCAVCLRYSQDCSPVLNDSWNAMGTPTGQNCFWYTSSSSLGSNCTGSTANNGNTRDPDIWTPHLGSGFSSVQWPGGDYLTMQSCFVPYVARYAAF